MAKVLEKRLTRLLNSRQARFLRGGKKGIEKESLRVNLEGFITQTDHPRDLGSPLTHPHITTDYSEALLEFVTPPFESAADAQQFLHDIHHFTLNHMPDDEMLWNASMPCRVGGDESIRLAEYGRSHAGRMKYVYRMGLGYRYGRIMQTISGVHFNYSIPDRFWPIFQNLERNNDELQAFQSDSYLAMMRNVLRYGWLLFYLFGSSPAICKSFLVTDDHDFPEWDRHSLYEPYGTTLRMSNIGYKNELIDNLHISYNKLDEYIKGLLQATNTVHPAYAEIGVQVDGAYRQLNDHVLQIENEFYSPVRPKRPPKSGERPLRALQSRGIGYVELRAIDVNPYYPTGVSNDQLYFLEAFLVYCLLRKSHKIDLKLREEINHNELAVARWGRRPDLKLQHKGGERDMRNWAAKLLRQMEPICEILDGSDGTRPYTATLEKQKAAVQEPERTPSAQILAEMKAGELSYHQFAKGYSLQHEKHLRSEPLAAETKAYFTQLAAESHEKQAEIEEGDEGSFEEYLARYYAQQ